MVIHHQHRMKASSRSPVVLFLCSTIFMSQRLEAQIDWPQIKLTQVASGLSSAVHATSARDGSDRLFVVQQPGRIRIVQTNTLLSQPFLDITNRVGYMAGSVYGLLS